MKKKGFTLIELLAVVVILAIVALIAIPALTKLIENVKIGAVKNSVYGMMEAGELSYIYNEQDIEDGQLTYTCDGKNCKTESGTVLKFKGPVPNDGEVRIKKDGKSSAFYVKVNNYCAFGTRNDIKVWKGDCKVEPGLYDSDNNLIAKFNDMTYLHIDKDYKRYTTGNTYYIDGSTLGQIINRSYPSAKTLVIPDNIERIGSDRLDADSITSIVIPNSVKSIANINLKNLKSLYIPDSVTELGSVYGCKKLTKIRLSKSQKKSGNFRELPKLESIELPEGITEINSTAFMDCESLKKIVLPSTLEKIGDRAFTDCESLNEINIPTSVKIIGEFAFAGCNSLKELSIPKNVEEIGHAAFYRCANLEKIKIDGNIDKIEYSLCSGCKNLREVIYPESVTSIGSDAFSGCDSLEEFNIKKNIIKIDDYAFRDTPLKSVKFDKLGKWHAEMTGGSSPRKAELDIENDYLQNAKYLSKTYAWYNWTFIE